jgi:D-tyrosyl-tRNA(Tyr) deacylase
MRVVIQRVSKASVSIANEKISEIGKGLLILAGFEAEDNEEDLDWVAGKIVSMRIFGDETGKMNLSVLENKGEIMIISQFTLHAMTKKGNRPSFIRAARPETAIPLYEKFIQLVESKINIRVKTGNFGADMKVNLTNDGPVTIVMDSKNRE